MKTRPPLFSIILLCALCVAGNLFAAQKYEPSEGDIVFQSLPHGPLVDAIEGATKSRLSHCGVVMKENGAWVVYEALGTTHSTPLKQWIAQGREKDFFARRLRDQKTFDAEKLRAELKKFSGKPYDIRYRPDDDAIYCSELVYKAYDRALGIKLGEWQTLGSLNWEPFKTVIIEIEGSVPEDRLMITPAAVYQSELLQTVSLPPEFTKKTKM